MFTRRILQEGRDQRREEEQHLELDAAQVEEVARVASQRNPRAAGASPRSRTVSGTTVWNLASAGNGPRRGAEPRGKIAHEKRRTRSLAKDDPVYCMRAVGATKPQPQVSTSRSP